MTDKRSHSAGKGDKPRPYCRTKYELGYLMLYGTDEEKESARAEWDKQTGRTKLR